MDKNEAEKQPSILRGEEMNRQTRRDFFTNSVAGVAVLLTGLLPKEEWVPGCCAVKPYVKLKESVSMVLDQDKKTWVRKTFVVLNNGSRYEEVYVDTDETCVRFTSFDTSFSPNITCVSDNFYCPIYGKDLECLETFDKNISKESIHKYVLINNKGEYGFLSSDSICWNFRPCNDMPSFANVENLRKIV